MVALELVRPPREAVRELSAAFRERRVKKRYRALLVGRLEGSGCVDTPIEGASALSMWRATEHTRSLKYGWITTVDLWVRNPKPQTLRPKL